ncbi:hypothetical protein ACF08O_32110 [Streptomyces paradoxus]|uniref:hypothetical protein n=1 Tax=Streptomyces paradoxus TaxID=66375 RepID=UPI003702E6D7
MDDSLSFESFFEGAKKAAHRAMEDHGREEYDEFALHAGVAVERLAKAVLVMRNPLYLVEMRNGNADLLLYFGGDLDLDTSKVRTVGAGEALRRLRRMGILPPDPQLDLLIELRNGTAHTTIGDQAKTLIPTFSETIMVLLTAVATTSRVFWGRWARTVIVAVDKQLDEIHRDVEIRIDQARHLFEDRFGGLPEHLRQRLAAKQSALGDFGLRFAETGIEIEISEVCPACKSAARVLAVNQGTKETPHLTAIALRCTMCYLKLATRDELEAAGVDVQHADELAAFQVSTFFDGEVPSEWLFHMKVKQFLDSDPDDPN